MEPTAATQVVVDTTTVGPALSDDKPKLTGQETQISLADLHNSAGGSNNEYPGKTWKTRTDISVKDPTSDLPLGIYSTFNVPLFADQIPKFTRKYFCVEDDR